MPPILHAGKQLHALLAKLTSMTSQTTLVVGYFPQDHYPDDTPVAQVASAQEYGTPTIPARPFLRPTIASQSPRWAEQAQTLLKKTNTSPQQALTSLGQSMITDIQTTLDHVTTPPLKPATIAHKTRLGRPHPQKPLIDTGLLRNSLHARITTK